MVRLQINRNSPCHCGSGKKYKKCCLNKKNIIQIHELKEERFFQQKHSLVDKIRSFIMSNLPYSQFILLQEEFSVRSNNAVAPNIREGFFQFWLFFCHRYENGLRGIQWFFQEQQTKLSAEEKRMAENWTTLTLKVVQAVDKNEKTVVFEDLFTKERFTVLNSKDNVPAFSPWYGTISLFESFGEYDYFNGVRSFNGPSNILNVVQYVQEILVKEQLPLEEILFTKYPELLRVLMEEEYRKDVEKEQNEQLEQEIHQHVLQYKIINQFLLNRFFQENKDFLIDKQNQHRVTLSWVGNWKEYLDSELTEAVLIAEVFATLSIEKDKLIINSFDQEKVNELKELLKQAVLAIQLFSENTVSYKIPINGIIKNSFVQMSKDTPPYFSLYAQTDLLTEVDTPIPKYNNKTIRQLVKENKLEDALTWLKQVENNMYQQALHHDANFQVTVDVNTVRKELGLPLSPFVTGREHRSTSYRKITNPYKQVVVDPEDIPYYEALGFKPGTIKNFYAVDFVQFYKEKTIGKAENTTRKYRNSLYIIRQQLEAKAFSNWGDCSEAFWVELLQQQLMESDCTKSFQKDFISTIKAFAKWVDKQKDSNIAKTAISAIAKMEDVLTKPKVLQQV
ncbi:SEC-C metal-binding domain-containing protein [Bacillus marasmi]|uniref:SEC-C metal-binding domain-containing protein n=1 Tax=Bacillus marasmi TaxID=1926279 RepID=UPI0011C85B27|nr:SEC-C metal-binding domain-containing protein [Bacillus marasmi]